MSYVSLILGIVLLLYGRTLYWVFVAVAGFFVGVELGTQLLADQAEWVRILAAVACGILGAILGMLAQRVAFCVGGLFAGGYLGLTLAGAAELPGEPLIWFAVGGILGAIIAALVMDWAIIALSSLAGAAAIVGQFELDATVATLLFIALAVIGMAFQGRRLRLAGPAA
ncbi:MAG TPA: DUF4203 domain-containing protein [Lacipirellulaceae bacterium]|nr:DUF4203 domain-containing protein [Lacipirellulaceae bacterium]